MDRGYSLLMQGRDPTFIRAWREHRGLTLEQLGNRVGVSHGYLSKIENGKKRYNQQLLEDIAEALNTDPASLLMRNPSDPEGIWSVWDNVPPIERPRAIEILRAFTRTGTRG